MMRRSCVWWAAFAAAVMIAAGTPAAAVTVNEGEDLAAAITNAAAGELIQLKSASGTGAAWPLSGPVTVTQDLIIRGEDGLLPIRSIIEGNASAGACNGNVVNNGDFEAGDTSSWVANPTTPAVIVNDPGQGASGDWYARLTLDPCATPTGLAPDQVELHYEGAGVIPPFVTVGLPESVRWNGLSVTVQTSTVLNIWMKIHAPAPGGETLTFTLTDGVGTDHVLTLNGGQIAAESNGDLWKRYELPVGMLSPALDPGDMVVSLNIEALFPVNTDPTVVLIGALQFSDAPQALPTAGQLDIALASASGSYALVDLTVPTYGPQAVRLGGLTDPALRFSVRADTPQPGDKLEMMLHVGDIPAWSGLSESLGATCQSISVPLTPGPSVTPVFRATIQPPAAVAGPVTKFVIDDLSVSVFCDWLLTQLNNANLIADGDMENAVTVVDKWSAVTPCKVAGPPLPPSYFTSPGCNASARALLLTREIGAPSVAELRQNVTFPSSGSEIRFKLKVGQPGGADSTFKFDVDGTVLLDAHAADATLAGVWREYILPYPAAWHDTARTLRFSAELVGGVAPPSFLIDDVCIGLPPGGPVLSVANNATLRLENLTVSTGTAGVSVTDTATLEFVRCATENISGPGLYFSAQAKGIASNSVFTGCSGPAVLSDSTGLVTVYQCTAKGNGEGIRANSGSINLAASIIEEGNVAGEVNTWLNLIRGSFPAAYEQASYENLNPALTVNYAPGPWTGKLEALQPVLSGHSIEAADPVTGLVGSLDGLFDFEGEARSAMVGDELQVGADQEGGVVGTPMWMACTVSPAIVGPGEPVTITVLTQGIDLGIASLRIVPEEPQPTISSPDPYSPSQCYEIPLDGSNTVTISFSGPRDKISVDPPGVLLYAEGVNRIYLNDGTDQANPVLYGNGMPATAPGAGDCTFLVDTTPPTLLFSAGNGDATAGQPRIYTTNDTLPGTGLPGLQGAFSVPASDGTIVDRAIHCMLNPFGNGNCADTAASGMLTFGIEAVFEDRPPAPLTSITTSGFLDGNSTTFADKQDGQAWLEGLTGPVISTVATYDTAGSAANIGRLTAHFDGEAAQSVPDPWRFAGKPAARDRAGNEVAAPNEVVLWWMWRAQAEISGGPRDTQTLSPRFDWKLRRNIKGPDAAEAAPIIPYVKAKLWRGADPAADREISTMSWVQVTDWSGWISGPITPETDIVGFPLSTYLKQNQNDSGVSHTLMLTVVGADEAGNIQPAGYADNTTVTVAELGLSCVAYTWWYNGQSQENVSVDTEARVTLWELAPGPSERSFGSVARVPLPPENNRLQARATLTARLPESIRRSVIAGEVSVARAWIKWTLYEDGNPVASGGSEDSPLAGTEFVDVRLPQNPTVADSFVLGDMKNRKREKRYVLTAQTALKTFSYVGGLSQERVVTDPTPASVSFTVYPKEVDDKLRDERPTRIYERE